jgi:outer membrane murein-binding lipoprotein Lpp
MKNQTIIAFILLASLVFAGCVGQATITSAEAQKRAQCQAQLASCTNVCNAYWFADDKETCKANCNNQYDTCLR